MNASAPSEPTSRRQKNLQRRFTVEKCAKPQSVRVPDSVLATHTVCQDRICQKLSSQLEQAFRNLQLCHCKFFSASGFDVSITAPDGVTNVSAEAVW
jgi:hypothetical protein